MAEPIRPNERPPGVGNSSLRDEAYNSELDALESAIQDLRASQKATVSTPAFNLVVTDLVPTAVSNVNEIEFSGATVTDDGNRKVTVTITNTAKKHTAFLHFFEGGGGAGIFSVKRSADLSGFTEARLHAQVNSTLGSTMRLQYSDDSGSTWKGLDDSTNPEIDSSSTGMKASAWTALSSGAKADVWLRVWNVTDNQDPNTDLIQRIFAELRGYGV